MPFVIQCPFPDCRKFMLLEDHARGSEVACLICGHKVKVEPSASGEFPPPRPARSDPPPNRDPVIATPPAPRPASLGTPPAATVPRQRIVNCPKCSAPLRVPPGQAARLQCPRCQTVFAP